MFKFIFLANLIFGDKAQPLSWNQELPVGETQRSATSKEKLVNTGFPQGCLEFEPPHCKSLSEFDRTKKKSGPRDSAFGFSTWSLHSTMHAETCLVFVRLESLRPSTSYKAEFNDPQKNRLGASFCALAVGSILLEHGRNKETAAPGDPLLLGLCDLHQRQVCPGSLLWYE